MQVKADTAKALARKYPESVVIVTTRSPEGLPNAMAVGWVMPASGEPAMLALGIDDASWTYELIRQTRQFVVAFPSDVMSRETLHVGSHSGRGRDKLAECGLKTQAGSVVQAPLIADAVANFECELVTIVKPGDCPIVVGNILAAHVNEKPDVRRLCAVGPDHLLAGVTAVSTAV